VTAGPTRLKADALGLDLRRWDARVVWATGARASSEYSSSYVAACATGLPAVFPRSGDHPGTWLAESGDRDPWLEVTFPPTDGAVALLVLETCGIGCTRRVRDVDSGAVLFEGARTKPRRSPAAALFVPLTEGAAPRRLRLEVEPYAHGDEWKEIDAVALLTASLDELRANPPLEEAHRRYAPDELDDLAFDDPRLHWATGARASSTWGTGYEAKQARGRPRVFPQAGDRRRTWLARSSERTPWLEVTFPEARACAGVFVAETCGAGATVRIEVVPEEGPARTVWRAAAESVPERTARLLFVPLAVIPPPRCLRLHLSPVVSDYRQIDAVALSEATFEELQEPYRDPDEARRVTLVGEVVAPPGRVVAVHATLRSTHAATAANGAAAFAVRRDDDDETVTVRLDATPLLGLTQQREEGQWAEVAARLPELAAAFAGAPPAPDARVALSGSVLKAPARVVVQGLVERWSEEGGFRAAARRVPLEVLAEAVAGGARPGDALKAAGDLEGRFTAHARPLPDLRDHHPRTGWSAGWVAAAIVTLGLAAVLPSSLAVLAIALAFLDMAIFFASRRFALPAFARGSRDGTGIPWESIGTTVAVDGIFLFASVPLVLSFADGRHAPAILALLAPAALGLRHAISLLYGNGRSLLGGLLVLLPTPGTTALRGTLGGERPVQRKDHYVYETSSYTVTEQDEQGRSVTRTRTTGWWASSVGYVGRYVDVERDDGTRLRFTRPLATTVPLPCRRHAPGSRELVFEGSSAPGDPVFGRLLRDGHDARLVLGSRSAFARRLGASFAALAWHLALAGLGLAIVLMAS
jgi:hypothetical protein